MNKRYKPLIDKMYFIITLPTAAVLISALVISAYAPMMFFVTVPSTLFTAYFFVSPLFGYVELGEEWVFIKYGFFMKKEIKEELLGDSIFVFTPNGEVKELPSGATAIDFAYSIHSHIGETIVGAKADGQIIPLSIPI